MSASRGVHKCVFDGIVEHGPSLALHVCAFKAAIDRIGLHSKTLKQSPIHHVLALPLPNILPLPPLHLQRHRRHPRRTQPTPPLPPHHHSQANHPFPRDPRHPRPRLPRQRQPQWPRPRYRPRRHHNLGIRSNHHVPRRNLRRRSRALSSPRPAEGGGDEVGCLD